MTCALTHIFLPIRGEVSSWLRVQCVQSDVAALERDMELLVKEVDLIHKRQEGYIRERDVLNKLR